MQQSCSSTGKHTKKSSTDAKIHLCDVLEKNAITLLVDYICSDVCTSTMILINVQQLYAYKAVNAKWFHLRHCLMAFRTISLSPINMHV